MVDRSNESDEVALQRRGRVSLLIGVGFLFACLAARRVLGQILTGAWQDILGEGLLISGWVAMWRPLQIYLYDWWPLARRRRVLRKIRDLPVELRVDTGAGEPVRPG